MRRSAISMYLLVLIVFVANTSAFAPSIVPNPVLYFIGQEPYSTGGKQFIRYKYSVDNADAYPNNMFAPAPELPPCGTNKRASRSWVDIFDQRGNRLYGFCALGKPGDLNSIFFPLPVGEVPPSWIYIEITDRQTNTKYKSNLAETTL